MGTMGTTLQPGQGMATAKRAGGIWEKDDVLNQIIKQVSETVVSLERRLTPILRSEPPPPQGDVEKLEEVLPDLVQRLRARIVALEQVQAHLDSLVDRLEI